MTTKRGFCWGVWIVAILIIMISSFCHDFVLLVLCFIFFLGLYIWYLRRILCIGWRFIFSSELLNFCNHLPTKREFDRKDDLWISCSSRFRLVFLVILFFLSCILYTCSVLFSGTYLPTFATIYLHFFHSLGQCFKVLKFFQRKILHFEPPIDGIHGVSRPQIHHLSHSLLNQ